MIKLQKTWLKCAASILSLSICTTTADLELPLPEVSYRDFQCMQRAIHYEAAGESTQGKIAVANVILNRVKHSAFPASICGVIYQRVSGVCQFTWNCQRNNPGKISPDTTQIAYHAVNNRYNDTTGGALFFRSFKTDNKVERLTAKIGNHYFYTKRIENGKKKTRQTRN